jgi:hypothetical protein
MKSFTRFPSLRSSFSIALDLLLNGVLVLIFAKLTRTVRFVDFKQWNEVKRYHVLVTCIGFCTLLANIIFNLGCTVYTEEGEQLPIECSIIQAAWLIPAGIASMIVALQSIVFSYCRLYMIMPGIYYISLRIGMDKRFAFWKWYKYIVYALQAICFSAIVCAAMTGDLTVILDGGAESTRVLVFKLLLVICHPLLFVMLAAGTTFIFVKIVILVFTTSSKVAKLLRTDDRQLVFALRRRMYFFIASITTIFLCIVLDILLNKLGFVAFLVIVSEQLELHFLEFVRAGLMNLDEYELRAKSVTEPIECEGVSEMVIESLNLSELEEVDGKEKRSGGLDR